MDVKDLGLRRGAKSPLKCSEQVNDGGSGHRGRGGRWEQLGAGVMGVGEPSRGRSPSELFAGGYGQVVIKSQRQRDVGAFLHMPP